MTLTYEICRYVFLGGLIGCILFFIVAAILFFVLRIPRVISDLSGRTARKAIESIRTQNEKSGDKSYQSSAVNLERGKLTDKISRSGRLIPRNETPFGTGVITEKISTQKLGPEGETEVLGGDETSLLTPEAGATDVLSPDFGETEVISHVSGETEPLSPITQLGQKFTVEFEITFVHTSEVIA